MNISINTRQAYSEIICFLNILSEKKKNEKQRLKNIYSKNEEEYQKILNEKYSIDNIFKKEEKELPKEEITSTEVAIVEYKENIITRIINKIKRFFKQ